MAKRKNLYCEECKIGFEVYSTYYSHIKLKHKNPSVSCFHCCEKFTTVSARNHHYYVFASRAIGDTPLEIVKNDMFPVQRTSLSNYLVDLNQ